MDERKMMWGKGSDSKVIDGNETSVDERTVAYTKVGV